MTYPIIPNGDIVKAVQRRIEDPTADLADLTKSAGKGPELSLPDITAHAATMRAELKTFESSSNASDRDHFEGTQSPLIHELLKDVDLYILDDPGFWAWLSVEHFLWLVTWRESGAFAKEPATWLTYLDGRRTTECVVSRMYLRGQVCKSFGHPELANAVEKATDFWRSHILRVSTGYVPSITGAFVQHQANERMTTKPLRVYARRLNRLSTNLVFDVYEDGDGAALIAELAEG